MCDVESEKYEGFAQFAEIQQFAEDTGLSVKQRKRNISGSCIYTHPHNMLGPRVFEIIGKITLLTGLVFGREHKVLEPLH